jgi:RNA polymerase sigma-70 factor, ECF subfamily
MSKSPKETCSEWVHHHSGELYGFAFRWCGRQDLAEDLVAETFGEAWKSMSGLKNPEKARAWLFRILRRRCARVAEERQKHINPLPLEGDTYTDPRNEEHRYQIQDSLQKAIQKLDEKHRLPFLAVTVEGLSCRDAAEQLGLPLGTLLNRVHRAKKELQHYLKDLEHEGPSNIQTFPGSAG